MAVSPVSSGVSANRLVTHLVNAPGRSGFGRARSNPCIRAPLSVLFTLADDDKTSATQITEWLDWYANSSLENAAKDIEAGNFYEAWRAYNDVADWYKGGAEGKRAAELGKAMLANPEQKAEIKAGDKFAKLKLKISDLSPKKALKALAPMAGKKYRDTAAGKQAAALIKQLEAALK